MGKLALFRSYGDAQTEPRNAPTTDETLFLLFSQTKVLTSSAVPGRWSKRASFPSWTASPTTLPEFAQRGKGEITLHQVMTHQGGFPSGDVTKATWTDPRPDARRSLRLFARLDAGNAAAIPPARRRT